MKKLKNILAPVMLSTLAGVAHADIIGGTIEASYWYAGIGGDATAGSATVDLENDLNLEREGFFEIAASIEHPVPLLPNVKLKHTSLSQEENGSIGGTDPFDGVAVGDVKTDLDLTHYDAILYYEILDNWVALDIGLNVKKFDGHLKIESTGGGSPSNTNITEFLPLPYAKADFELPFTGMAFGAEIAGISYSDNAFFDAKARIRQNFGLAFAEIGYRTMAIKLEDLGSADIEIDADYSGVYLSTGLDF